MLATHLRILIKGGFDMKRAILLVLGVSLIIANDLFAQSSGSERKTANKSGNQNKSANDSAGSASVTFPAASTENKAYGDPSRRLTISDPVINILNQRAAGNNFSANGSGIIGMPRSAY